MAFKPDRPLCFSSMGHLNPDTLRFAVLLREGPPIDGTEDWKKDLSDEEIKILEEENKKKKAERKIKPCVVKKCKEEGHATQLAILERVQLLKKIKEIQEQVLVMEEDIKQADEGNLAVEAEVDHSTELLAELRTREKKGIKEKVVEATRLKQTLDISILKAKAEISKIQDEDKALEDAAAEKAKAASVNDNNNFDHDNNDSMPTLSPLNFDLPKNNLQSKHTGTYDFSSTGFKKWSCCMGDDHSQPGCADDHSVGVKSTLVEKGSMAYKPYQMRKEELKAATAEKKDLLHHPVSCPPKMNKGFRDVRQSHNNYSYYSKNHGGHVSSLDIAITGGLGARPSTSDGGGLGHSHSTISFQSPIKNSNSASVSSRSHADRSVKSGRPGLDKGANINMGGSMDSGGLRPPHDQGKTSLVFLEASMAYTNSVLDKKRKTQPHADRPSTSGAFPMMGSMRVGHKKITSGSFPVFANVDLELEYNPVKDTGMARSDIANSKIHQKSQIYDSASLLASYSHSKGGMKDVGQQRRHLGLAEMKRRGGRPLTSQKGPHLRFTSTVGKATSLAHMCQKQC